MADYLSAKLLLVFGSTIILGSESCALAFLRTEDTASMVPRLLCLLVAI
jgi:hypothetical protein